jgi:hypothetical protein
MKINDILYDILLEEFANKKILKACMLKWYGENPTNEQTFEADNLLTKFYELKTGNKLKTTDAEVITFLNNFSDFDASNIPNATSYSLQQMKFLIGEFYELDGEENNTTNPVPEILRGKDLPKTPERIEASKSLWYSNNTYTIINEDGFRVYSIPDRQTSINFGYYEGEMSRTPPYSEQRHHMQWCTTREITSSNLYSSYRDRRTFYFVIDESKNPEVEPNVEISQYYLSALQYSTDSPTNFRVTSILNSGSDPVFSEEELYRIYPKLRGHIEKIKKVDYDYAAELGESANILDRISENEGQYEFSRMPWRFKKAYIDSGKPIRKQKSWASMQDGLKTSYIDLTQSNTVFERFKKELYFVIKAEKKWLTSLERRLTILGYKGLTELVAEINKDTYDLVRVSQNSNDVVLYRTKVKPSKYGIWNSKKNDWYEKNGITYNDVYKDPSSNVFSSSKDNKRYLVQIFNESGGPTNSSFVILYPTVKEEKARGFFMTYNTFLDLKENEKLFKEGQTDVNTDVETYSDIKEWK